MINYHLHVSIIVFHNFNVYQMKIKIRTFFALFQVPDVCRYYSQFDGNGDLYIFSKNVNYIITSKMAP